MQPYLVIDEGVTGDHSRLINIWAHPDLISNLLPKMNTGNHSNAVHTFTCTDKVHLALSLHPLADDDDVSSLQKLVKQLWSEVEADASLQDDPRFWITDGLGDIDSKYGLSGFGELLNPKSQEARRKLSDLLFEASDMVDPGDDDDEEVSQPTEADESSE